MRRGRVHIVTTEGPALVQRLSVEEGLAEAELSAVCLNGTTTRLPITGAYTYFVRDHVRRLSGRAAYRLDLDRRVDSGSSWMLGAWIAHLLLAENRLAMSGEPAEIAVFATGEVAFSADAEHRVEIRAVEHVPDKVARLADAAGREAATGRRVLLIVPKANADEARGALARLPTPVRDRVALHAVAELEHMRALLSSEGLRGTVPRGIGSRRRWRQYVATLAVCVVVGAALAIYFAWRNAESDWKALWQEGRYLDLARSLDGFLLPFAAEQFREGLLAKAAAASPLNLSVTAHRPADGGFCAGLRFRGGETAEFEVPSSGSTHRLDGPRSLCGFSVRSTSANGQGHIWIMLRLSASEGVRESLLPEWRLVTGAPSAAPVLLTQELPLYRDTSWAWTAVAVWAPASSDDVASLLGADGGDGDPASLVRLDELGLAVARTRIDLAQ